MVRAIFKDIGPKGLAFIGLVTIQVGIGITYKLATRPVKEGEKGGFNFSTTSAVTIAEFIKVVICLNFLLVKQWRQEHDGNHAGSESMSVWGLAPRAAVAARQELSMPAVLHILLLSMLYTVNNQFTFYITIAADPGSVFLFKACATMLVAFMQWSLLHKQLHRMQWTALMLQMIGIVIVQYNPCTGQTVLPTTTYFCIAISVCITALTTVRNEYMVKNFKISLTLQNLVLYTGGMAMNLFAFCFIPNPNSAKANLGLFDGYDTWAAKGVVFCNAFIGIAISLVYKYADALVKMIATDCTTTILMVFSVVVLHMPYTLVTWFGVSIVFIGMHQYGDAAKMLAKEEAQAGAMKVSAVELAENGTNSSSSTPMLTGNRSSTSGLTFAFYSDARSSIPMPNQSNGEQSSQPTNMDTLEDSGNKA